MEIDRLVISSKSYSTVILNFNYKKRLRYKKINSI